MITRIAASEGQGATFPVPCGQQMPKPLDLGWKTVGNPRAKSRNAKPAGAGLTATHRLKERMQRPGPGADDNRGHRGAIV